MKVSYQVLLKKMFRLTKNAQVIVYGLRYEKRFRHDDKSVQNANNLMLLT